MLTGREIQKARELLDWTQAALARRAALPVTVVDRAEASQGEALITLAEEIAIKGALFVAGIDFRCDGPRLEEAVLDAPKANP